MDGQEGDEPILVQDLASFSLDENTVSDGFDPSVQENRIREVIEQYGEKALQNMPPEMTKVILPIEQHNMRTFPPKISEWVQVGEYPSPLVAGSQFDTNRKRVKLTEHDTLLVDAVSHTSKVTVSREYLRAGPRSHTVFHPKTVKAAILTAGGLCPGINIVVREMYRTLRLYGCDEIYGIRYGFRGLIEKDHPNIKLNDKIAARYLKGGGSYLGCCRSSYDPSDLLDSIVENRFTHVYVLGAVHAMKTAWYIAKEIKKRKLKIAVVGIPKTIENDLGIIDKSFGFETAIENALKAINSAKVEANSAINGIGLVKLMGRMSGFLSMYSVLSSRDVDFCLIPEVDFEMNGPKGLNQAVLDRIKAKGHCVIVVAEGAGKHLTGHNEAHHKNNDDDAGERSKLPDIGEYLKGEISRFFKEEGVDVTLKYIDPTYIVRACGPNEADSLTAAVMAQNSVHAAMAGYCGAGIGLVNTHNVIFSLEDCIAAGRTTVNTGSRMWRRVLSTTGQGSLHDEFHQD